MNVLTLGTFDVFHTGHVNLLRRCREIAGGGRVTVALNSDEFIVAFKHHAPVIPFHDRLTVLGACRYVDWVTANSQTGAGSSSAPTIDFTKPEVIVVGSDWEGRDYLGQLGITQDYLNARSIEVRFVPYTQGISSTAIRERMAPTLHTPPTVHVVTVEDAEDFGVEPGVFLR